MQRRRLRPAPSVGRRFLGSSAEAAPTSSADDEVGTDAAETSSSAETPGDGDGDGETDTETGDDDGAEQFDHGQEALIEPYFSFFYASINAGSLISINLTPFLAGAM